MADDNESGFEKEFERFDNMLDNSRSKEYIERTMTTGLDSKYLAAMVAIEVAEWLEKIRKEDTEAARHFVYGYVRAQSSEILSTIIFQYVHAQMMFINILPEGADLSAPLAQVLTSQMAFLLTGEYISHKGDMAAAIQCILEREREIVAAGPRQRSERTRQDEPSSPDEHTDKKHLH